MKTIKKIDTLRKELYLYVKKRIGLVPTMGYLHNGHSSLIDQSIKENDISVVSIFVNPYQFGPNEDFNVYPRDMEKDLKLLEEKGVDILFSPDSKEMYPENFSTFVEVEKLSKVLCGRSRHTHFRGVCTVVLKLFNIVNPNNVYFGAKDAQQAILIKRMKEDLNLDINIRIMPIIRDEDGLAFSSRNRYLSKKEREAALLMPEVLKNVNILINNGVFDANEIRKKIVGELKKSKYIKIDYVEVVNLKTLKSVEIIDKENTLVAAAIKVGETRLIDNFILGGI
jgi:pantoate--beta-alanine ligase